MISGISLQGVRFLAKTLKIKWYITKKSLGIFMCTLTWKKTEKIPNK